jgi:hypothetical protein
LSGVTSAIEIAKESIVATKAGTGKGIILLLSCAAQFMVVLDIAIVNVALPSIQKDLGIGQSTLQWIVIAYGLMLGGFLLLGGRMATSLGAAAYYSRDWCCSRPPHCSRALRDPLGS